ncbi:hypothetical protein RTG_00491 [Rhodotorula toruloides ATCC 204091]|uniref:DUF7918 domain-containing protein n=1 Tax=Rhodotorula toruloides TaxID=5286 RepID=A0A0K3C8X3_RHOTO|nr:hypothetical protein RTG_00491 [Rhodotorula toruloides ATCC 204091]
MPLSLTFDPVVDFRATRASVAPRMHRMASSLQRDTLSLAHPLVQLNVVERLEAMKFFRRVQRVGRTASMAPLPPAGAGLGPDEPLTKLSDPLNVWSASVLIDDKPVEVYKVVHEGKHSTCYIEAVEGKEFKVEIKKGTFTATDYAAYLRLDGTDVGGSSIERSNTLPATFTGKRVSSTSIRPYTFAKIALTDDTDIATKDESVIKNLGTISVEIYRTTILAITARKHAYRDDVRQHIVDERSKKATMSHSTSYGEAKYEPHSGESVDVSWTDPWKSPFHTLSFRYRSRALLELEDIVKLIVRATPPPNPLEPASSPAAGPLSRKRKTDVITISDDEDDDAAQPAKVAKQNGGGVKAEKKPKVKDEPLRMKVKTEGGQMHLAKQPVVLLRLPFGAALSREQRAFPKASRLACNLARPFLDVDFGVAPREGEVEVLPLLTRSAPAVAGCARSLAALRPTTFAPCTSLRPRPATMAALAPAGAGLGPAEPLTKLTDPLNRWSAWVTIDDKPVEVYKVEHEGKKSTCYIEAVEGKEFRFFFVVNSKIGDGTEARVRPEVDGMALNGIVFRTTEKPWTWDGKRISDQAVRHFTFAKLSLTDDSDLATTSEAVIKKLGTIQLPIVRCLNMIDERTKKAAMSHQAGFGAAKPSTNTSVPVQVTYVDKEDNPFYVLEFKYRSRALLELEDIVEPLPHASPSPEPAPAAPSPNAARKSPDVKLNKRKTNVITLSDDDDDDDSDLRAKIARLEAENAKLKNGGVKEEKKPKIKDEPLRMNVKKENGQTVIDLLD